MEDRIVIVENAGSAGTQQGLVDPSREPWKALFLDPQQIVLCVIQERIQPAKVGSKHFSRTAPPHLEAGHVVIVEEWRYVYKKALKKKLRQVLKKPDAATRT